MKTNNELIERYYRENPEAEIRHRNSQLVEAGGLPAIGALIGATKMLKTPSSPMTGIAYGALASAPIWAVRKAHRRKKILEEMGVNESVIGSFMEPIKREI